MSRKSTAQQGEEKARQERRYKAFDMYKAGFTEMVISKDQGVTCSTTHKDIAWVLETLKPAEGDLERMRALQNSRYAQLLSGIWADALHGDLGAIDKAEKLMRGINVINGLNKAPTGQPGSDAENPLWLSMSELARRIPMQATVHKGAETINEDDAALDEALDGMFRELPEGG